MTSTTTTNTAEKQKKTGSISWGRKSRHRKNKAQEIARIAAAFEANTADSEQQRLIPTDRGTTFPAALALRDLTPQDEVSLVQQLGYVPGNAIHIATRMRDLPEALREEGADDATPVVVQLYPIALRQRSDGSKRKRKRGGKQGATTAMASATTEQSEASNTATECTTAGAATAEAGEESSVVTEPFPTSYWLTHPGLHTAVSQLELERFVHTYEQRLASAPDAAAAMERAHRAYGAERWGLLDTTATWPFPAAALDTTRGIAGNRNFHTVKCLHAHTAHVLSGGAGAKENVVGQWVLKELVARRTRKQQANGTRGTTTG